MDTSLRLIPGGDPILRRLKDDELVRSASANRNTVKALEEQGLISRGKGLPTHDHVACKLEKP